MPISCQRKEGEWSHAHVYTAAWVVVQQFLKTRNAALPQQLIYGFVLINDIQIKLLSDTEDNNLE
jgi:hypothetical protein